MRTSLKIKSKKTGKRFYRIRINRVYFRYNYTYFKLKFS